MLSQVWKESQKATDHSWGRLNTVMRNTLRLAIGAGFEFQESDFKDLGQFRPGYWLGSSDEWIYSAAIAESNYSAATAYESWKGRSAIIADGVSMGSTHDLYAHKANDRESERLHVGSKFKWDGETVTVTSFNKDGDAVACSYADAGRSKIKRRYVVTRDKVIRDRAERKERAKIREELLAIMEKHGREDVMFWLKDFGIADDKAFDKQTPAKLASVLGKLKISIAK